MLHSNSLQLFPIYNENYNPNIFVDSSRITNYKDNNYESMNSLFPRNIIHKKNSFSLLTEQKYQFKKAKPSIAHLLVENIENMDKPLFDSSYDNNENYQYTLNENNPIKINKGMQRCFSSGNFNMINFYNKGVDYNNNNEIYDTDSNEIMNCNNNFNIDNVFPKKTLSQFEDNGSNYYNNNNEEIFSNQDNSNIYNEENIILNSSINSLINNELNNSVNSGLSLDNYNHTYIEEEPNSDFKLSDFIILNQIGHGAEGKIFTVKWTKNDNIYVLKRSEVKYDEDAKKKKEVNKLIIEFVETTGSDGVIKMYGNLLLNNELGTKYFYELMELGNETWDKEITDRGKNKLYYQEYELMDIFSHLIKTFSSLQLMHFTHRDINPHNIINVNGKLKICDFGYSEVLKKDGIIIQKIRGSELFMSPILFKGYHSGVQRIKHNPYKSDVFSLGMCFFFAASLTYNGLTTIREIYNMNIIKKVLHKYLGQRYSLNLIELLFSMLQIDENKRPDFNQLEMMLPW